MRRGRSAGLLLQAPGLQPELGLEVVGVCFVQLCAEGKISSNEVYFDRTPLLAEIESSKKGGGASSSL